MNPTTLTTNDTADRLLSAIADMRTLLDAAKARQDALLETQARFAAQLEQQAQARAQRAA